MKRVHQIAIKCRTYLVLTKENWAINKPRWNHHRKVILQKTTSFKRKEVPFPWSSTRQSNDRSRQGRTDSHSRQRKLKRRRCYFYIYIIYRYQNITLCNRYLQGRPKTRGSQKCNIYNNHNNMVRTTTHSPLCTC
jgi:hypothetical protein